jgi:uncharacterized damage-inducible protein DinB
MSRADSLLQQWLRHRTVLHELLEAIGNEHTHFKPWKEAFSLGALAVHIAASSSMFVQAVKDGRFPQLSEPPSFETMEDVRRLVSEHTEKTKSDFNALTDRHLDQTIPWGPYHATGEHWLITMRDHEIHHKGQLFVYARMVGVEELPFFTVQPPKK